MNNNNNNINHPNEYYYRQHQYEPAQLPDIEQSNLDISNKSYTNRLAALQVFSTSIILIAGILQGVAIGTNDWFVLNVNEFIPTSKGGLWQYCYLSSSGLFGQFTCLKYEELPNFAVFLNSRLFDSRILLICSCGFCFFLVLIEVFGILCLCFAETRGDLIDSFVARRSARFRSDRVPADFVFPASPKIKTRTEQSSKILRAGANGDEVTNSARFTTSIIVNGNSDQLDKYHTVKPTGYFAYLAIALITLVGSVMDFVLKVSGFALFDAYVNRLLSFNTVFLAYRSYSYWMMVVSMVLLLFFWLFKVFSTRYIINLTRKLIETRAKLTSYTNNNFQSEYEFDPFKPNYTTITRVQREVLDYDDDKEKSIQNFPIRTSFIYDLENNEDDLSSSSYSIRNQSLNSNYFHEYQEKKDRSPTLDSKSIYSVIRF